MDNPTNLTRSDIDDVVRALLGNNAYTVLDNIEGEDKFGTAPVRDAYFALCHTDLTKDMDSINGFIQKNQYPSPKMNGRLKLSLIDLEALWGDRAQASAA